MENLFTESEIRKKLAQMQITYPDRFFDNLEPCNADEQSNQLLLQTSATILLGVIANQGVTNAHKQEQVESALQYTHLLMQKIDIYAKKD